MGRIRARLASLLASAGTVLGHPVTQNKSFQPPLTKAATRYERKTKEGYRSKWRQRHVSVACGCVPHKLGHSLCGSGNHRLLNFCRKHRLYTCVDCGAKDRTATTRSSRHLYFTNFASDSTKHKVRYR